MSLRLLRNNFWNDDFFFNSFFEDDDWDNLDLLSDALQRQRKTRHLKGKPEGQEGMKEAPAEQAQNNQQVSNVFASHPARLLSPLMNTDLIESTNDYHVHVDLPGVEPGDIDISIAEGKYLVLKAERKHVHEQKTDKVHSMERAYGGVQRKIRLPVNADLDKVQTKFKNGVLSVTFPKKEVKKEENVRKLQIMTE